MPFFAQKFILFDVQTTGTNPETSDIIEAGWGLYHAGADPLTVDWQVRLVAPRDSVNLSRRIQKLTGLAASTWTDETAISYEELSSQLSSFLHEHAGLPILVHYARFKRPFLFKALHDAHVEGLEGLWSLMNERMACTYELARRMMPHLKSYSLRAVAGYAGYSLGDKKRSRDHLIATAYIWKYMVAEGSTAHKSATTLPLQDPGIRQKRLSLPDAPGVYYFLDQAERILYVGKASSLKHRLNSYFRGQKTKGSRLNEMLTRAVDFRFRVVRTELEALFLESDEIKRIDPPYNRLLKTDERRVQSFRLKDWLLPSEKFPDAPRWAAQLWGPLLSVWNFQWLLSITGAAVKPEAIPSKRWLDAYFSEDVLEDAKGLIFATREPDAETWQDWARKVWETWLVEREQEDDESLEEDEPEAEPHDEDAEATPEEAAAFIQHTLLHALRQLHRARWLLRLMDCTISWQFRGGDAPVYYLRMQAGVPTWMDEAPDPGAFLPRSRWERLQEIDLPTHDRLTILYSEIRKGLKRGDQLRLCLRPGLVLDQDRLRTQLF
ncbi:MAG TPA: GIY-YIG nuclease family protein [Oligoflexus sp.]|uniref:GIY-YIG nuclease family protein n=1 Tax=Oligoflexus sp. TaxID=1971216 RepID=UPI002D7E57F6|nr:GIY-YIG nuclease family protein [Oligoflexus sp.]HET9241644.1 GIY-YIG nuclease family protein [Oligoflexus sp.]